MKWLKRTAAAGMTAVMLFSCFRGGAVQPGEELTRGETASILLEAATDYNADVTYGDILKGYPGGDLNEDGAVTRAQALVMLQRAFGGLPEPKGDNARSGYPAANLRTSPPGRRRSWKMCWHPALWREPVQPPFSRPKDYKRAAGSLPPADLCPGGQQPEG